MAHFIKFGNAIRQPNPTSALVDNAQAMVDAGANIAGQITDPAVLQRGIDALKGVNTPAALLKVQQLKKQQATLVFNQAKANLTAKNLNSAFLNAQYYIGKQYALEPAKLEQHMGALYEAHLNEIGNFLAPWKAAGVDPSTFASLQTYDETIMAQYNSLKDGTGNFAFVAHTDHNGKIDAFSYQPIKMNSTGTVSVTTGSKDDPAEYLKTTATYNGRPLVLNAQPSQDPSKQTAVIGNLHFGGDLGKPLDILHADPKGGSPKDIGALQKWTAGIAGLFTGQNGARVEQAKAAAAGANLDKTGKTVDAGPNGNNVHFTPDDFNNPAKAGPGSIFKDVQGIYYYINDAGDLKQGTADAIANTIGISKQELQSKAPTFDTTQVQKVQSAQDPNTRANAWITDPVLDSPMNQLNSYSPTSMSTSASQLTLGTPTATPPGAPVGPPIPATTSKAPAIKSSQGPALAQNNTQQITAGAQGLPNAMQTKG